MKIRIVLMLTNTVLNNFERIRGLENGHPVPKYNHRVQLILFEKREHFWIPSQDNVGQFYRFHFHKNHPFLLEIIP